MLSADTSRLESLSLDQVPFVDRIAGARNAYVATGWSGQWLGATTAGSSRFSAVSGHVIPTYVRVSGPWSGQLPVAFRSRPDGRTRVIPVTGDRRSASLSPTARGRHGSPSVVGGQVGELVSGAEGASSLRAGGAWVRGFIGDIVLDQNCGEIVIAG